jgi:hypothetical protein
MVKSVILVVAAFVFCAPVSHTEDILYKWLDGSVTPASDLPGWLISDNCSYWGKRLRFTGSTYKTEGIPRRAYLGRYDFKRGLTDGRVNASILIPANASLIDAPNIVFDFKQNGFLFKEVDLCFSPRNPSGIEVDFAVSDDGKKWRILDKSKISRGKVLERVALSKSLKGRYLRCRSRSSASYGLAEVVIWGIPPSRTTNPPFPDKFSSTAVTSCELPVLEKTPLIDGVVDEATLKKTFKTPPSQNWAGAVRIRPPRRIYRFVPVVCTWR